MTTTREEDDVSTTYAQRKHRRRVLSVQGVFDAHGEPCDFQVLDAGANGRDDLAERLASYGRYLMVEENERDGRTWYTAGNDPCDLLRAHDEQEFSGEWINPVIYDLDRRQSIIVERSYRVANRLPWQSGTVGDAS